MMAVQKMGEREPGVYEFVVESKPDADIRRSVFYALAKANMPMLALQKAEMTLEDIFLQLTDGRSNSNKRRPRLTLQPAAKEEENKAEADKPAEPAAPAESDNGGDE